MVDVGTNVPDDAKVGLLAAGRSDAEKLDITVNLALAEAGTPSSHVSGKAVLVLLGGAVAVAVLVLLGGAVLSTSALARGEPLLTPGVDDPSSAPVFLGGGSSSEDEAPPRKTSDAMAIKEDLRNPMPIKQTTPVDVAEKPTNEATSGGGSKDRGEVERKVHDDLHVLPLGEKTEIINLHGVAVVVDGFDYTSIIDQAVTDVALLASFVDLSSLVQQLLEAKKFVRQNSAPPNPEPVEFAVISHAQWCLFENFLEFFKLKQLVVLPFDEFSARGCEERKREKSFVLRCVRPQPCADPVICRELAHNHCGTAFYHRATVVPQMVFQLALALGVSHVL